MDKFSKIVIDNVFNALREVSGARSDRQLSQILGKYPDYVQQCRIRCTMDTALIHSKCNEYGISFDSLLQLPGSDSAITSQKEDLNDVDKGRLGDLTGKEIADYIFKAGRYVELKEQNEKLESRHKKLLEGLSAAIGDYSKMYGPIERMAKTADEEREALKDEVSKRQRDETQKDPARATEPVESKAPR